MAQTLELEMNPELLKGYEGALEDVLVALKPGQEVTEAVVAALNDAGRSTDEIVETAAAVEEQFYPLDITRNPLAEVAPAPGRFGRRNEAGFSRTWVLGGVGVLAVTAVVVIAATRDGDKAPTSQKASNEVDVPDLKLNEADCDVPGRPLNKYKTTIGENTTDPIESMNKSDVAAIKAELIKKLPSNNFALAVMDTVMKYNESPVNFDDIKQRIITTLEAISEDEDLKRETCVFVLGNIVRKGDRVQLNSFKYLETSPIYDGDDLDIHDMEMLEPSTNGIVDGFWIVREDGTPIAVPTALMPDGRLVMSLTLGNENGDTNINPDAEPTVKFTNEEGNEVTVTPLPNGQVEMKVKDKNTGEETVVTGPAGTVGTGGTSGGSTATTAPGSGAPGTTAPGAGAPGTTAPGAGAPGTTAPGAGTPGTTAPGNNHPGTSAPATTAPPATAVPTTAAPATTTTRANQTTTTQPDVCPNIPGIQVRIPEGFEIRDGICKEIITNTGNF